jgi:hypothetical protein
MRNITLSADERLIEQARERASRERSTLNEEFRRWLAEYASGDRGAERAMRTVRELQKRIRLTGLPMSRDELNER